MKKLSRSLALVAALAAPASAVACGGTVEQPQTTASASTKAPVGTATHGFVKVVGEALGEVPLRPEQRTELEKLAVDADARHASMAESRRDLMAAVADQIEKGAIDHAALQPKLERVRADFEKVRPADNAAIARVHALLDAAQRDAFVDALEAKLHGEHGHRGAGRGEHAKGKGGFGRFGHMGALAEELKLTDEQRAKIRDIVMENRPHSRKGEVGRHAFGERGPHGGKRALQAFRSDDFDPSKLGPEGGKDHLAKGATHMIDLAEQILPILTPEQRKIAADKIRGMQRPE